ncbi:unnamed protein product [Notodromas monacha]|uniref:3-dehydrosphinganine reductase n=1 Tax=Notodromas monacha TaxID=399045 RepID=A0A7R9BH72_9CRUS|nr:unnamed protein product [Notodromas monacha]CAG0913840.1 unnamed protein product [Notodromas monacha]
MTSAVKMTTYHLANLLEKMTSADKDYRFMATNDLMSELQKDNIILDDDSEKKVVKMLLKLLEDKNGEVQNLAVKCMGPLVGKVRDAQVEHVVESLCSNMLSEKEQLRDISSIGLKTVLPEISPASMLLAAASGPSPSGLAAAGHSQPVQLPANIVKRITPRIVSAISREDVSVQLEALDILADLLSRFGPLLIPYHISILDALEPQLASVRLAVRKRSIICLGHLTINCQSTLYTRLIDFLLDSLHTNASMSTSRTYVQCIGAISRSSGHRFGLYLERVLPLIFGFCRAGAAGSVNGEARVNESEDDELRENCLQACEAFMRTCPKHMQPYLSDLMDMCLEYLNYDPNYSYGDEEEDDLDSGNGIECSKKLEFLCDRFKEREENVKVDILHVYTSMLKQLPRTCNLTTAAATGSSQTTQDVDEMETELVDGQHELATQMPAMVRSITRQMKEKGVRTRQACLALLTELISVAPGTLDQHVSALIPGILFSLGEKNAVSSMRMETLSFLYRLLSSVHPSAFHAHIAVLLPPVITAVGDSFYKITSEALLVTQQLVKIMRPLDEASESSGFDFAPYVNEVYQATLHRLRAADIDQEVKERAIMCMGVVISHLGDNLVQVLPACLPIFLDRLRNEITRLATVKSLNLVASSRLCLDLRPILAEGVPILATFLRKNVRALKLHTLLLLDTLVKKQYTKGLRPESLQAVMQELPALINESDLHIAQLTLTLLTSIGAESKSSLVDIDRLGILNEVRNLLKSPLLQGAPLESMLGFFRALVAAQLPGLGFKELLHSLLTFVHSPSTHLNRQANHSVAKCVSALVAERPSEALAVVNHLLHDVQTNPSDSIKVFSVLALGEIGRQMDLTGVQGVRATLLDNLSANSEEVKSAASHALGLSSLANLNASVPFLLAEIQGGSKRQYLLLHALKEVIVNQSATAEGVAALRPFVGDVWALLFAHAETSEEGMRNVVAECLGRLTLSEPADLLPRLKEQLMHSNAFMRSTVITAIKFTISDQPELIREVEMGPFKHTVDDGLDLRKAAFECMYTLLDSAVLLPSLDLDTFLDRVDSGLRDHHDIKMLSYLMLSRLATLAPHTMLARLDKLVEPLKTTCVSKARALSVKQESEKLDELKRAALRVVVALQGIHDADKNPHLNDFMSVILSAKELKALYDSVQNDAGAVGNSGNSGASIWITGGSSGIGLSLAKIAVNHGASVSLFARDEKKLREAKDFLEKSRKLQTSKIFTYSVDVSSGFEAVKSAVAQAEEALGNTYMLINCAGYCFSEVFEKIPMEQFERMMSVNYLGSVYFSRAVVQKMKAEGMGSITFVSSQAGIMGLYGFTGYSASKFALRGLAESLYMELKPYGVGVTFSMPPDTDTPGLVAENVTKPAATKEISAGSGLSSPEQVADKILKDAVGGVFLSCHGLEGHLLGILCSGMAPALSVIELLGQDEDPSGDFILQQVIQALIEDIGKALCEHGHFGLCQAQVAHLEMLLREREDLDGPGPVVRAVSIVEKKGVTRITSPQLNLLYKVMDEFPSGPGPSSRIHYVARTIKFCDCDRFFRNILLISPPLHVCEHILAVHLATVAERTEFMHEVTMENDAVVEMIVELFSGGGEN